MKTIEVQFTSVDGVLYSHHYEFPDPTILTSVRVLDASGVPILVFPLSLTEDLYVRWAKEDE